MKEERRIIIYKFLWTSVKLAGSSSNQRTFQPSCLYQNIVGNDVQPEMQKVVNLPNGNELQPPPIWLGDSAFQRHPWLQNPFGNKNPVLVNLKGDGYFLIGRVN